MRAPHLGGFTLAQYQHEIDAGRPVLIQVTGHTMLGVGYDNAGSTIYVHDTWDFSSHSMTWGGSYSGMEHYAVGVFVVEAGSYAAAPFTEDFEDGYANGDWRLHLTNDTYSVNDIKATAVHSGNYGLAMYGPSTGYSYSTGSGHSRVWALPVEAITKTFPARDVKWIFPCVAPNSLLLEWATRKRLLQQFGY
jgi:hypothetical protein